MKLNVYSIFDKAVNAYLRPFFFQADNQALRMFTDECCNADSPLSAHPEDYALFRLGTFEDNSGDLEAEEARCLGRGHELVAATRQRVPEINQG